MPGPDNEAAHAVALHGHEPNVIAGSIEREGAVRITVCLLASALSGGDSSDPRAIPRRDLDSDLVLSNRFRGGGHPVEAPR